MCLTNNQKKIDEKAEHDAMALMVVVICAFTLLGAVIGFIAGYGAKTAVNNIAQQHSEVRCD